MKKSNIIHILTGIVVSMAVFMLPFASMATHNLRKTSKTQKNLIRGDDDDWPLPPPPIIPPPPDSYTPGG